jgi:hypothetical protein
MPLQWSTGLACFDPHAGASRAPARLPTNQTLDEVFGRDAGFAMSGRWRMIMQFRSRSFANNPESH